MDRTTVRRFALLMQIHHLTHPSRIADRYGVTPEYVRRQWRFMVCPNMPAMAKLIDDTVDLIYANAQHSGRSSLADSAQLKPEKAA